MTSKPRKIIILGTGGTIAGTARNAQDHVGYDAAQLGVEDLVAGIPALAAWPLELEQVAQVDSKDMSHEIWRALALRVAHWLGDESVAGIVITHGTDTLEETAYFLNLTVRTDKPVVVVGSMRPSTAISATAR